MLTEKLANIPVFFKLALITDIIKAAANKKNKIDVKKIISKTTDEFLPSLKERTPTVLDKQIVVIAKA